LSRSGHEQHYFEFQFMEGRRCGRRGVTQPPENICRRFLHCSTNQIWPPHPHTQPQPPSTHISENCWKNVLTFVAKYNTTPPWLILFAIALSLSPLTAKICCVEIICANILNDQWTYIPLRIIWMAHSLWTLWEHGRIWQPVNASCRKRSKKIMLTN
jgi:hypothetical protein